MEVISTHWRSCAYVCRFFCSIFNKSPLLFDFITSWFHKCKRIITRKRKTKFIKASVWSVKITFLLLKYHRFIDYSNAFCFFLVVKRLMITKNSVVKIQNFVVNHETWPVKSNPVYLILLHKFTLILPVTHSSPHEGKKSWQSLYIEVQSFNLILNWENSTQFFSTNPCFLWICWSDKRNAVNSFLRKHGFVEKNCLILQVQVCIISWSNNVWMFVTLN